MNIRSKKKLNNGVEIPYFGLGVFRSSDGPETSTAVRWALEEGYIHIDTAKIYGNEKSVGIGLRESGVPREKIFVTTKLWNDDMREGRQMEAFEESLTDLGLDYIDLYLIHWPVENYLESWDAMEKIYATGKARAVGVSNFQIHHLEKVLARGGLTPAVNQIEIHPLLTNMEVRRFCGEKGIAVEAYSPLGGQDSDAISKKTVKDIAAKHGKTPAQVLLRWDLQQDIVTIPKSIKRERIRENCRIFDFELSGDEIKALGALNENKRNGADPDDFDF